MKHHIDLALFMISNYKQLLTITAFALGLVLEWPPGG